MIAKQLFLELLLFQHNYRTNSARQLWLVSYSYKLLTLFIDYMYSDILMTIEVILSKV